MTIVSGPDTRNAEWAKDKSAFGQRMLMKMGWSEGKGLGKNQQGTNTNLRAIRREEGLGIGAKTDTFGDEGFSRTSQNFHGVLANLQSEHGNGSSGDKSKKSKKKRDKSKKLEKSESGLTLSQTKVTAGHAKKMRESKDLTKKSKEDMAAVFGMKVADYQKNSVWGRLSSLSANSSVSDPDNESSLRSNLPSSESDSDKKKIRKEKKKRKRTNDETKSNVEKKSKKAKKKQKQKENESS